MYLHHNNPMFCQWYRESKRTSYFASEGAKFFFRRGRVFDSWFTTDARKSRPQNFAILK